MFQALRLAMIMKFGDAGNQRTFVVDFEMAAINAIATVFPNSSVRGCSFHFRQAVMRHVQLEGLSGPYSKNGVPQVRHWIRQIMGLTLLPVEFILRAWGMLRSPPSLAIPCAALSTKMNTFSEYFQRTWIDGPYKPHLWSHFSNTGPRTTNLAEGWHNQLNHSLSMPHPSPRNFLHWLQRCQFEVQCRQMQLQAGRAPKPRDPNYVKVDKQISIAKLNFTLDWGTIFIGIHSNPPTASYNMLDDTIRTYLSHAAYMIVGQA